MLATRIGEYVPPGSGPDRPDELVVWSTIIGRRDRTHEKVIVRKLKNYESSLFFGEQKSGVW